jgi:hypothetical protein
MSAPQESLSGADYPQLAHLMYRVPELAIFRSFREVTLLHLLSLQAELLELVEEYEASYNADLRGDSEQPTTQERQELSRSFRKLRESDPVHSLQWEALDSIFKKLNEFREYGTKISCYCDC